MKKSLTLALVALMLLLAACTAIENPAKPPFKSSDVAGMAHDEVLSALQEAGFTNVTSTEAFTKKADKVGTVSGILIDGKNTFSESNVWEGNVPVEVTYYALYALDVSADVSVSGEDGQPIFTISTTLPDDAVLVLTLDNNADYMEQQEIEVADGVAVSEPFTNSGRTLKGDYTLTVVMEPASQSRSVRSDVGDSGEYLGGNLVRLNSVDGSQYIFTEYYYTSPVATPTVEEVKALATELDAQMAASCSAAEETYYKWLDDVAASTSELLTYNLTTEMLDAFYLHVAQAPYDDTLIDLPEYSTYMYSNAHYISLMMNVGIFCKEYIEDSTTPNLAEMQDGIEEVQEQVIQLAVDRLAFLQAAGFTQDEIDTILNAE